ncbi:MAG: AAA family ATPase [Clostridiales bacterium]|nr:AAA family ATPase [Clostridiales bacterium]
MKREKMNELIAWKGSESRKPMVVLGARQVGKTWLMKEFGSEHFERTAYINLNNNDRMQGLFSMSMTFGAWSRAWSWRLNAPLSPGLRC